jgi:hypothetical protein
MSNRTTKSRGKAPSRTSTVPFYGRTTLEEVAARRAAKQRTASVVKVAAPLPEIDKLRARIAEIERGPHRGDRARPRGSRESATARGHADR